LKIITHVQLIALMMGFLPSKYLPKKNQYAFRVPIIVCCMTVFEGSRMFGEGGEWAGKYTPSLSTCFGSQMQPLAPV
jgi:hypothetical protein